MNKQYIKATSENRPKIDLDMLIEYISSNENFRTVEMRGVKTLRSMRQNYGDGAIGYVQLFRKGSTCTVEAKICPEHKVRNKNYSVEIVIDEDEESVVKAECKDCAASLGGCKHAVALLAWMYRKSEEPSPTTVSCYSKKPVLSGVGTTIKYKKICDIVGNPSANQTGNSSEKDTSFLAKVLNRKRSSKCNSHLVQFFHPSDVKKLSLHYEAVSYTGDKNSFSEFQDFCAKFLSDEHCNNVSKMASDQSNNMLWYELRYARIAASIIYEAAKCTTLEGSLVEKIMSMKNIDTAAMKRGRDLESEVLCIVAKYLNVKYNEKLLSSGLLLRKEFPMLGASPDGVTETAVIEVKCPSKEKTVLRFYADGKIMNKYKAQLHLQMYFAKKSIGHFCIADLDFENNKKVTIVTDHYDEKFTMAVIKKAMIFWEKTIFPILMKNRL